MDSGAFGEGKDSAGFDDACSVGPYDVVETLADDDKDGYALDCSAAKADSRVLEHYPLETDLCCS